MKRTEQAALIAARIQRALQRAEDGHDQSIDRLGKLAQVLTRGRKDAGLSSTVGQPVFDALARSMAAQVAAQKAMVELHEALAEVKGNTRFRGIRMAGLDKSDEPVPRETRLTLVERVS
ncbi:MAG: hypothetical protein ACREEY_03790 [Brevundimonas sp.]